MSSWPDKRALIRPQHKAALRSNKVSHPAHVQEIAPKRLQHSARQHVPASSNSRGKFQFCRLLPAILFFGLLVFLSHIAERFEALHPLSRNALQRATPPFAVLELPEPLNLPPAQTLHRLLTRIPDFVPSRPQHDDEMPLASLENVGAPRAVSELPLQLASYEVQLREPTSPSHFAIETSRIPVPAVRSRTGVRIERLAFVQGAVLGLGVYGFRRSEKLFGGVVQPFKIGNDLVKDHAFGFDELMHFQGGYRIAQAIAGLYRWAGVSHSAAEWIGACTSAGVMTTMEYIDGRRPNDEASYSDFTANLLGASFALLKPRVRFLQDVDLRFSYLSPTDFFRRKKVLRYERMTHWLTFDLKRKWNLPIYLAAGYSVRHARRPKAHPEFYFGIGLSPLELADRVIPEAAKPLAFLRFYHFGSRTQLF